MVATAKSPAQHATAARSHRGEGDAVAPGFESRTTSRVGDVVAVALIAIAFGLALGGPATLVLVAPIVFGVPHVGSDVRYLVVRGPLRGGALVAIVVPLALITGQRATALAGGVFSPHVELALGFAAIIGAVLVGAATSSAAASSAIATPRAIATRTSRASAIATLIRPSTLVALVAAIAVPALARPQLAMVVLLHAHNLVGIGLWLAWSRRGFVSAPRWAATTNARAVVVTAIAAGLVAIFSGACDGIAGELGTLATAFAPGIAAPLASRIALAFAFMQAVHYIAWLYVIPRSVDAHPVRGLARDFGRAGVIAIGVASVAVPLAALATDAARVREVYLSVVVFHAWLEVAVAAYLVARRA